LIKDRFYIQNAIRLPINPELSALMDAGNIEKMKENELAEFVTRILKENDV